METATHTTSLPPIVSNIFGYALLALIVVLIVNHFRKKNGKPSLFSRSGKKSGPESNSNSRSPWYGNYPKLISLDAFKKASGKSYVVFDLETSGLDASRDRIVEIGAVRVTGGKVTGHTFQQLVDPKIKMPADVSAVNHITDEMLKGQPDIKTALSDFLAFVDGDLLVAHNGGFDAAFLDNACDRCGFESPKKYFDTMRLSVYWDGLKNRKLDTFLKAAGIDRGDAHRALSDAIATAELCIKSLDKIK